MMRLEKQPPRTTNLDKARENNMTETTPQQIDVTAVVATAMAQLNPRAVERMYAKASFPADMPNIKLKLPRAGTAEQYIVATHALRLIQATPGEPQKAIFRAVDRKTYDLTMQAISAAHGSPVKLSRCVPSTRTVSGDSFVYRGILAVALLKQSGVATLHDDVYNVVVGGFISNQLGLIGARSFNDPTPEEIKTAQHYFGRFPISGWFDFSDRLDGEEDGEIIASFEFMADAAGIDISEYTANAQLTEKDAALLLSKGERVNISPVVNAAVLLLARAVAKDRAYSIQHILARDPAIVSAAKAAQEKAESRAAAAETRIAELEEALLKQQRTNDKLQVALEAQQTDVQELSALRDALWRSVQRGDAPEEPDVHPRSLPDGIVVVGGHAAWARRLTEQLPTVRAWPSGTTCPSSVIASATELWVQANYMAHKEFYAIINVARANHVPVRYFSGTGVASSVKDLMWKDE